MNARALPVSLAMALALGSSALAGDPCGRCTVPMAPTATLLGIPLCPQLDEQWCWAAATQMAVGATNQDFQPKLAQIRANERPPTYPNCTNSLCWTGTPTQANCDRTGFPEATRVLNWTDKPSSRPLSWCELKEEVLDHDRPVTFTLCWFDATCDARSSGHVLTIGGVDLLEGEQVLYVHDPLPCCHGDHGYLTYLEYVATGYVNYSHWQSRYCIQPSGGSCRTLPDKPEPCAETASDEAKAGAQTAETIAGRIHGRLLGTIGEVIDRLGHASVAKAIGTEGALALDRTTSLGTPISRRLLTGAAMTHQDFPKKPIENLLQGEELTVFPVEATTDEGRTANLAVILVRKIGGRHHLAGFGFPTFARRLGEMPRTGGVEFLVSAPELLTEVHFSQASAAGGDFDIRYIQDACRCDSPPTAVGRQILNQLRERAIAGELRDIQSCLESTPDTTRCKDLLEGLGSRLSL